jgi:hypothetical protein
MPPQSEASGFDINACDGPRCQKCRDCHTGCDQGIPWIIDWACAVYDAMCKLETGSESPQDNILQRGVIDSLNGNLNIQADSDHTEAKAANTTNITTTIHTSIYDNPTSSTSIANSTESRDFHVTDAWKDFPIFSPVLLVQLFIDGREPAQQLACIKELPHPIPRLCKRPPPPCKNCK